jgi:hypothetical protein
LDANELFEAFGRLDSRTRDEVIEEVRENRRAGRADEEFSIKVLEKELPEEFMVGALGDVGPEDQWIADDMDRMESEGLLEEVGRADPGGKADSVVYLKGRYRGAQILVERVDVPSRDFHETYYYVW